MLYKEDIDTLQSMKSLAMKDIKCVVDKGQILPTDYQNLDKAIDIVKDIETIEAMESYGETDYEVSSRAMSGRYYPNHMRSYDNGYYDNGSYERGRSARTGRYVSMDHDPMSHLNNMMAESQDPNERAVIQRVMDRMR